MVKRKGNQRERFLNIEYAVVYLKCYLGSELPTTKRKEIVRQSTTPGVVVFAGKGCEVNRLR